MFGKTGNLRCVIFDSMLSRLSATKIKGVSSQETQESQETEGDHSVRQIPRAPIKKNCLLIDISPDLPTPNILFSPSSQHFLSNFSLLPIVYLPPLTTRAAFNRVLFEEEGNPLIAPLVRCTSRKKITVHFFSRLSCVIYVVLEGCLSCSHYKAIFRCAL